MGSYHLKFGNLYQRRFKVGSACTTAAQLTHRKSGPCNKATLQTQVIYRQRPWQWSRQG